MPTTKDESGVSFEFRVKDALKKRNMNLTDMADVLDISLQYLSDIIKGRRAGKKAKQKLELIIKYLDLDEEE